ncbi:MAG: type II secretion system protein GspG [Verrucomicrobia bacterium]|nr:type II secretion system protein GspG [Verrucomicrobiota bacterium]MCH8510765.1 type II secretion system protein GspG [Kiritimatiellia bacterium]
MNTHPTQQSSTAPARDLSKKSAFTLLEILLVIVIITVVAGVAISNLDIIGTSEGARRDATAIEIQQLSSVVQRYYLDVGSLPPNLDALVTNPGASNWRGPYLRSAPTDAWRNPYTYTTSGREFEIRSDANGSEDGPISSNDFR